MFGFLNKLFGYEWSLYVTTNNKELRYSIDMDSPVEVLGYLAPYFEESGNPEEPWQIWLNYNKNHTTIPISKKYFDNQGNIKQELLSKMESLDSNFMRSNTNIETLTVEDCVNKEEIPLKRNISERSLDSSNQNKTFLNILNDIFQARASDED